MAKRSKTQQIDDLNGQLFDLQNKNRNLQETVSYLDKLNKEKDDKILGLELRVDAALYGMVNFQNTIKGLSTREPVVVQAVDQAAPEKKFYAFNKKTNTWGIAKAS